MESLTNVHTPEELVALAGTILSRWHGKDKICVEIPRVRLERSIELVDDVIVDWPIGLPFE